jgi:hypothetical protein
MEYFEDYSENCINIVTCRVVRVTKRTGSSSDECPHCCSLGTSELKWSPSTTHSDCPQTTFAVPHKPSSRTYRKHVTWSLCTVVTEVCLPSRCLEMGCITPLFYCCMRVMPLPGNALTCHNIQVWAIIWVCNTTIDSIPELFLHCFQENRLTL